MREYEVVVIIHPDLDETATKEVVERVKSWIADGEGTVDKVDPWGKRKLAYPIRKQTEGQYYLLKSKMSPSFVAEMERNLRFLEPIIRFMITVVD